MVCSNNTEDECLDHNLVGTYANREHLLKEIEPKNSVGLLFNYDEDELIGIFQADSDCRKLKDDIWIDKNKGVTKYPAQFKFKMNTDYTEAPMILLNARSIMEDKFKIKMNRVGTTGTSAAMNYIPEDMVFNAKLGEEFLAFFMDKAKKIDVKLVRRRGTSANMAAIMSRNHSHHIGSHVMPRTGLKSVRERLRTLHPDYEQGTDTTFRIIDSLKGRLDEYIQKKADFTAEIITQPLTTLKSMMFFDEVILNFTTNTLLMDNIGANENVRYVKSNNTAARNRLRINYCFEGTPISAEFTEKIFCDTSYEHTKYPYSGHCSCPDPQMLERKPPENGNLDKMIILPGNLGEFAFYTFLENFIRNGIKHNKDAIASDNHYVVSVNVNDPGGEDGNEFYKVHLWDNWTNPRTLIATKEGNEELHSYLQLAINRRISKADGSLRKEAWGIAEMKIMATLLRGSSDFINMSRNLKSICLEKDGKERLAYEFYVMKPKSVAVVASYIDPALCEGQKEQGVWWFSSLDEFIKETRTGKSPASFKFLIIDDHHVDKEVLKNIKPLLPFRVLVNEAYIGQFSKIIRGCIPLPKFYADELRKSNPKSMLEIAWKAWIEGLLRIKGISKLGLVIFFHQDEGSEPTKSWIENTRNLDEGIFDVSIWYNGGSSCRAGESPPRDNTKIIMYDRHSGAYSKFKENQKVTKNELLFYETYDKTSSDFTSIFSTYNSSEKCFELAEAGLLNILIIDERIAEVAHAIIVEDNHPAADKSRISVAERAGIYIATHACINGGQLQPIHGSVRDQKPRICVKCDISEENGNISASMSVTFCKECNCPHCPEAVSLDAVIIHQGILEGILGNALHGDQYGLFIEALQKNIPYVVIDSGRGIPPRLPDIAKFLSFSLLEDFLMKDSISKYCLTKTVMSLTRRRGSDTEEE